MMNKKFDIEASQTVCVILLKTAFSEAFMAEFREGFYPFFELSDHAKHIAQLVARGVVDEITAHSGRDQFVEGYGPIGEFVAVAKVTDFFNDEVIS
ncbi:hypothetical protein [Gluconobacter morbifer]|uniref:Uncharacterized protein n=1 Tax=Gluconobacter morbifer G707 TaxID=1088869 RepID=G6XKZ1_9PROT|nr:hypothetical protein [Gluconobacter morbifer]EHH67586.1 hypothetical protein GMO_21570 [Gluconobacter morbifer G707]